MSRKIVALAALALSGAMLGMPDPSSARGGGFHGTRGPVFFRHHGRVHVPEARFHANPIQFRPPVLPHLPNALARTTVRAPFVHLSRRSQGTYIYGSTYPITGEDEGAYFGMPYDPGAAIPVYGPGPLIQNVDPAPPLASPRLSVARDENQEACRSERVTLPASEGEREILVVRC